MITLTPKSGLKPATTSHTNTMFIFPRVCFRYHFFKGAPIGSIASANPYGWMTTDNFQLFLHYFVKVHSSYETQPSSVVM